MDQIRIGIVGTGNIANNHATTFAAIKGAALSVCHDVVPGRGAAFAAKHGVGRAVDSLDDLFDGCDLVVIATPDAHHAAVTLAALAAGKHVLCEKPLTVTLDEARRVADAARQAASRGQRHAINLSKRSTPAIGRAIELVRSGALGEIRHVSGSYLQAWLASSYLGPWTDDWLLWRLCGNMGSGGTLMDLGVHLLDYATAIAGDVRAVRCALRTFPKLLDDGTTTTSHQNRALDANDTALIELDLIGGGLASLHTSRWGTGVGNAERLDVHGTLGALSLDLSQGGDRLLTCLGEDRHRNHWTTHKLPPVPCIQERLVAAIRNGTDVEPDLVRGARVQAMLAACFRSAETGGWETPMDV